MQVDVGTLATLVAALTAGGFASEVYRSWRDRKRVDLDVFYPTWQAEMERLHIELAQMRAEILLLSAEVHRLGGDPLAVRYPMTPKEEWKDE